MCNLPPRQAVFTVTMPYSTVWQLEQRTVLRSRPFSGVICCFQVPFVGSACVERKRDDALRLRSILRDNRCWRRHLQFFALTVFAFRFASLLAFRDDDCLPKQRDTTAPDFSCLGIGAHFDATQQRDLDREIKPGDLVERISAYGVIANRRSAAVTVRNLNLIAVYASALMSLPVRETKRCLPGH